MQIRKKNNRKVQQLLIIMNKSIILSGIQYYYQASVATNVKYPTEKLYWIVREQYKISRKKIQYEQTML